MVLRPARPSLDVGAAGFTTAPGLGRVQLCTWDLCVVSGNCMGNDSLDSAIFGFKDV